MYNKRYAAAAMARGKCLRCGRDRGPDGTKRLCRPCQDKENAKSCAYSKRRYLERRALNACVRCLADTNGHACCDACYFKDKLRRLKKEENANHDK